MNIFHIIGISLAVISFGAVLYLGLKTNLLHTAPIATGDTTHRPYSFSRFQLWLWTLVICPVFALFWGFSAELTPIINTTALILLGIPAATAVTSAVVASAQVSSIKQANTVAGADPATPVTGLKQHRDTSSFWNDMITDDNGQVSIGRLQHLIFTFLFVAIYIATFFNDMEKYPIFGQEVFVLMGISSGTYLIGKGLNK
ncbi:MAG: hypothetical protein ACI837_003442 [Crocinitomicaceae bacterium]|jgi:hypothetical protein